MISFAVLRLPNSTIFPSFTPISVTSRFVLKKTVPFLSIRSRLDMEIL